MVLRAITTVDTSTKDMATYEMIPDHQLYIILITTVLIITCSSGGVRVLDQVPDTFLVPS